MKIYDQHVHSFISSDTNESFENYIKKAKLLNLTHLLTTEHFDLSSYEYRRDDIPDFDKLEKTLQKLQDKHKSITFLKGVEIGYKYSRIKDIEKLVQERNFDFVLMSVHEDEESSSFTQAFVRGLTSDQAYGKYLNLCLDLVKNIDCFNSLAHIDFLLRYIEAVEITKHKEKLEEIMLLLIKKNKALEFNTRFLYQNNDNSYLKYIFTLYYNLGGKKITLGSDAHMAYSLFASFDEAIEILKEIGFDSLCFYQKGKEINIKI